MIAKITIEDTPVMIRTPHHDPDGAVNPEYIGIPDLVQFVKRHISEGYGVYGHLLNPDSITNLDLAHILATGDKWKLEAIAPPISPSKLPEGVQT